MYLDRHLIGNKYLQFIMSTDLENLFTFRMKKALQNNRDFVFAVDRLICISTTEWMKNRKKMFTFAFRFAKFLWYFKM